jgi:hypothetical protein
MGREPLPYFPVRKSDIDRMIVVKDKTVITMETQHTKPGYVRLILEIDKSRTDKICIVPILHCQAIYILCISSSNSERQQVVIYKISNLKCPLL